MNISVTRRRPERVRQRRFARYRLNSLMSRGWMFCLWRWQLTVTR